MGFSLYNIKKDWMGVKTMGFIIAGIIAVLLLVYLTYAMFNPEKF
ncbi:MAG: K(+)-transporting ATPase subunit F [Candidatus Saganbacteria bacterium]|nr:K(+)-transporting ATPase subunit F [Candidatus Saganbacteria bacterium]